MRNLFSHVCRHAHRSELCAEGSVLDCSSKKYVLNFRLFLRMSTFVPRLIRRRENSIPSHNPCELCIACGVLEIRMDSKLLHLVRLLQELPRFR